MASLIRQALCHQSRASARFLQARFALEVFFEGVEGTPSLGKVERGHESEGALRIGDQVTLTHQPGGGPGTSGGHGFALMEWDGGARGDMIADAVVVTLMQVSVNLKRLVSWI